MEAKKNTRITIKGVKEELNIEINYLKDWMKSMENRLNISETKVNNLQDKLSKNNTDSGNHVDNDNAQEKVLEEKKSEDEQKCKMCEKHFSSKRNLKKHRSEVHTTKINCSKCKLTFLKNSDLELHIKTEHDTTVKHSCGICGKLFMLEWRLNKHREGHGNDSQKYCHYFNNKESCPFDDIGCMFKHEDSPICFFRQNCTNRLCQFKHKDVIENDKKEDDDLKNKFNALAALEQSESEEIVCELYCKASFGYHICTNKDFDEFLGCDVFNVIDDYIEEEGEEILYTMFPCEKCNERFKEYDILRDHFSKEHTADNSVGCKISGCNFSSETIEIIKMHIGIDHHDEVVRRL